MSSESIGFTQSFETGTARRDLQHIFQRVNRTYPYQIEYWSTVRDLEALDSHKRSKRATILASSEDEARKRFQNTGIRHAHLIVHEGIMR